MPPLQPNKARSSRNYPARQSLLEALDTPPRSASVEQIRASKFVAGTDSSSELSSLSDLDEDEDENGDATGVNEEDDDDDDVNWEDAILSNTAEAPEIQDLDITLSKDDLGFENSLGSLKKGHSKIERLIRTQTHCMHVQFLLFHNAIRNSWINSARLHEILLTQMAPGIRKEITRWRIAAGLDKQEPSMGEKNTWENMYRDSGGGTGYVEPNKPDINRGGDPTIHILKVLAAYWRNVFWITAPGLRKMGYRSTARLGQYINSFNRHGGDDYEYGERIRDLDEFCELAKKLEGSRDAGAQFFTALLRAIGLEARMVANLQPIGFGWTKAEDCNVKERQNQQEHDSETDLDSSFKSPDTRKKGKTKVSMKDQHKIDKDLRVPIYWTEVVSPVTGDIIPVEALLLPNSVAMTPELLAAFEPRSSKAGRAKQVIAYVVAYSPDATAKDVTTRYLKRRVWPGKTKGFRMPVENIPLGFDFGPEECFVYDWFKATMRGYIRPQHKRTAADEREDKGFLTPQQAKLKAPNERDTIQSLRSSNEFVLERFLRREEAIRSGAEHARLFVTGKGDKKKEEKVYQRSDVVRCLSAETWHKEGRKIKLGETPLKLVPIRAVTMNRKREVDEIERETGKKPRQGLYAIYQTEYIIPPPIENGVIPKNAYGNIDCFVSSMVPRGAVHIPWNGTVRVCKKLGVDYAEAVTGFEFGSKMAVPVIEGVVVAAENEGLVKDAWLAEEAEKQKREKLKHDKLILSTWRKFIMGLRITERLHEEYGAPGEAEAQNPFADQTNQQPTPQDMHRDEDDEDVGGGGFLIPGAEDEDIHDGGFVVE
ncbi:hypothetical protein FQN57_005973 [Myotisia sp. PD_48]|nr:hypothetical protein FQN57_005973 [Myotisia sp. PD_48]